MGPLAAGAIVFVRFPFSDLSSAKLRPALVLAPAGHNDWILCQITSNPYADPRAVKIEDAHFAHGSLQRTSYVRPAKLFTASEEIVAREVGALRKEAFTKVLTAIVDVITQGNAAELRPGTS